jgi:acyl-CoA thioester hydrolase
LAQNGQKWERRFRLPNIRALTNVKDMEDVMFSWESEVRDYECDLQGIVNNATYQNYLEHARHQFLKAKGIDFAEVTARGIFLIVVRIEIDYKSPLKSGDNYRVDLRLERVSRIRFAFVQEIVRLSDNKTCIQARVITSAMNERGRPMFPREIEDLLPEIH